MKRFKLKWVRFDPNTMGESAAASSYLLEPGESSPSFWASVTEPSSNTSKPDKIHRARGDRDEERQATLAQYNRLLMFPLLTQKRGAPPKKHRLK